MSVLANFHLSAFVPTLITAITALTQPSALLTLSSLFSPFSTPLSPFTSWSLFLISPPLSFPSYFRCYLPPSQTPATDERQVKIHYTSEKRERRSSIQNPAPFLITLHQSHAESMSECAVVLVLLCRSCSAQGVSLQSASARHCNWALNYYSICKIKLTPAKSSKRHITGHKQ